MYPIDEFQLMETVWFSLQGQPVLICEQGDEESVKYASQSLQVPHTVDCLQGILTVIPLQLISYHIAAMKGLDVSYKLVHLYNYYISGNCYHSTKFSMKYFTKLKPIRTP